MNIKLMKTTFIVGILLVSLLALAVPMVSAEANGTTMANYSNSTIYSQAVDSDEAVGGDISNIDLSTNSQTFKWQGYYGNVSGNIHLENAAGQNLYTWAYQDNDTTQSLVIAVASNSVPSWNSINDTTFDNLTTMNQLWNLSNDTGTNTSDSAQNTFAADSVTMPEFNGNMSGNLVMGTGSRLQGGGEEAFKEAVLTDKIVVDSKDDFLFVGIGNANAISFTGAPADFELIVPVGVTNNRTETYYFYLELK